LSEWSKGERIVQVWRTEDGEAIAYAFRREGQYWMHWPSFATYAIARDDAIGIAYPGTQSSSTAVRDLFYRSVLPLALQDRGFEALHASSVLTPAGIVAFAGPSTAGKSTLAFGLSQRGYHQWSDDALVIRVVEGRPEAVPLPFSARLRPNAPTLARSDGEIAPDERVPTGIAAIFFLNPVNEIGSGHGTTVRPVGGGEAMQRLLMNAYELDPSHAERRADMLATYLDVASTVPIFELSFRHDRNTFQQFIEHVTQSIDAPSQSRRFRRDWSKPPHCYV